MGAIMKINVISLFPDIIESSLKGLVGKALDNKVAILELLDLKKFSQNEYGSVDDSPYGGGEGMVMSVEPLEACLKTIKKPGKVIYLTPQGQIFNQKKAIELSSLKHVTFVCGRYEGIDQRFIDNYIDEELSIGDYILSGGEIAASVVIDALLRNKDGVLGNKASATNDSLSQGRLKGHAFTRPKDYKGNKIPEILSSGDHKKIEEWKIGNSLWVTREKRPDLFKQLQLSEKEMILLRQYEDSILKKHD
jgi:tRNA (guanine37-N1)-methyltransferase